jgi:hypothetical protein
MAFVQEISKLRLPYKFTADFSEFPDNLNPIINRSSSARGDRIVLPKSMTDVRWRTDLSAEKRYRVCPPSSLRRAPSAEPTGSDSTLSSSQNVQGVAWKSFYRSGEILLSSEAGESALAYCRIELLSSASL